MKSGFVGFVLFSVALVDVRCGTYGNNLHNSNKHLFSEDDSFVFPSEPEDNQDTLMLLSVVRYFIYL